MPTDGTHVEVIRGCTSAADVTTMREDLDEHARRHAVLADLEAGTEIKQRAADRLGWCTRLRIRIGLPPADHRE